jgi:hypothetical protein
MNRKPSFDAVTKIFQGLTDEEQLALVDSPDELKKFVGDLTIKIAQNTFFIPFSDNEAPEKFMETAFNWRKLAAELGYTGPVIWKVKEGFTLKYHAPKAGPCYENFQYLQDWELKNEPTKESLAFWIPRLVAGSKDKKVEEQIVILAKLRQRFRIPNHHLTSFGSAALLSGLILTHFKRVGERIPLKSEWTRTDTFSSDGDRLLLGGFDSIGLGCGSWIWSDGRGPGLGCFPLGVELGQ